MVTALGGAFKRSNLTSYIKLVHLKQMMLFYPQKTAALPAVIPA